MTQERPEPIQLSFIIPAYNEEVRLPTTLEAVGTYCATLGYPTEIIVVDDGSEDETAVIASRYKNVRVLRNTENKGKGWSVRRGMLEATGAIRLFLDADNTTAIEQFDLFLPHIRSGYEIVIGSRHLSDSRIERSPLTRRMLGVFFRTCTKQWFGLPFKDTQCGLKAFTAPAAEYLFSKNKTAGWVFDVELLARAVREKYRVKEVPVHYVHNKKSRLRLFGMAHAFFELARLALDGVEK